MSSQSINSMKQPASPFIEKFSRNSSRYPCDKVSAARPTHAYEGKITSALTKSSSNTTDIYLRHVDQGIEVESVDDLTRQKALNHFSRLIEQASDQKNRHTSNFYIGIAATILGVGIGFGSLLLKNQAPFEIPLAATACGVGLAALGIFQSIYSSTEAEKVQKRLDVAESETKLWQDPIHEVLEQRRNAGIDGFQHVHKHRLKNTVIHPEEVRSLWMRDFSKLSSGRCNAEEVFSEDLLGEERMAYAWDDQPIPDFNFSGRKIPASLFHAMKDRYRECLLSFQSFTANINHEYESLTKEREGIYRAISDLRSQWIQPIYYLRRVGMEEASNLRHQALTPYLREKNQAIEEVKQAYHYTPRHPGNYEERNYISDLETLKRQAIESIESEFRANSDVMAIEEAYRQDCAMCDFLYQQAKLVVDAFFDTRSRELELSVERAKSSIEIQKSNGMQQFNFMLDRIVSADGKESLKYFSTAAPIVQRNWRLPDLIREPSWNEVYGRVPHFQPQFSRDISRTAWELFWSGNGLGIFAHSSRQSWNNLCMDNATFPFKQNWFNLHATSCAPRPGLFSKQISVPKVPLFSTSIPMPINVDGHDYFSCGTHKRGRTMHSSNTQTNVDGHDGSSAETHKRGRTVKTTSDEKVPQQENHRAEEHKRGRTMKPPHVEFAELQNKPKEGHRLGRHFINGNSYSR